MNSNTLINKRILVGVSGGIAAYKSPDLVRRLRERGAEIRVVMTPSATRFVGELTFQAVSGHPVRVDLLDSQAESAMGHIELARWAELIIVAPATADFMARLRQGRANDLLAALCLTTTAPVLLAPAMNQQMWQAAATRENAAALRARGVRLLGPDAGDQACGESGPGRMMEPTDIANAVSAEFGPASLAGQRVLITAGPTQEPIDAVRFISNRSSGRMAYAIARAALDAGATVTLVTGPVAIEAPPGVAMISVQTAAEMYDAVMAAVPEQDIFIAAAAVADYAIERPESGKVKKQAAELPLTLVPTKDILAAVAGLKNAPFTVGFAAETHDLKSNARKKLQQKSLNMIAANWVDKPGQGFNAANNELHVFWNGGDCLLPLTDKLALARQLVEIIADRFHTQTGNTRS